MCLQEKKRHLKDLNERISWWDERLHLFPCFKDFYNGIVRERDKIKHEIKNENMAKKLNLLQ